MAWEGLTGAMDGTNKGQDMGLTKGRIPSAGSSDF